MRNHRSLWALFAGLLLCASTGLPIGAQDFPSKTVVIVVPLAAGTGMDSVVRVYAKNLQNTLGKPVIVENIPGANTMVGTASVARSAPDGHKLGVVTTSAMAINPVVYKKIEYNPNADLMPVALYLKSPFILVVNPKLPIHSVADFIAAAKARGTAMTFSSPGVGAPQHLSMELVKQKFGVEMTHIPYRSTPQSITDIVGGHVDAAFAEAGASLSLIQGGQLRPLAVSSAKRLDFLPDVPTFAEAANMPDFEAVSWHMLTAPAATPPDIVEKLHRDMKQVTNSAEFKQYTSQIGLIPVDIQSISDTKAYIKSEQEKWGGVVKGLGLEGSQ